MYFGNERQHSSLKCHMSTQPPNPWGNGGAEERESDEKWYGMQEGRIRTAPHPSHPFQTLVVRDRGKNNPIINNTDTELVSGRVCTHALPSESTSPSIFPIATHNHRAHINDSNPLPPIQVTENKKDKCR